MSTDNRELRRGPRADAGHGEQARVGLVALEQRRRLGLEGPGLVEGLRYPGGQEPDLPVLGLDERRRGCGGGGRGLPGGLGPRALGPGAGDPPRPAEPGEQLQPPPVRQVDRGLDGPGRTRAAPRAGGSCPWSRRRRRGRAATRGRGRPRGPRRGPGPPTGSPARPGRSARSPRRRARRSWPRRRTGPRRGWRRARAGRRPRAPRRGPASRRGTLCCGTGRRRRACRRARRRTARRARPPCCGRGRWPAPPRRGRSGRPSATTCRRPGRARPRVWWMALSRWYPSGSRSTGWPPPSALTLPAAAPARHFPISRRGRRVPRRQHPTGPLGGRDVRPCAGARSAARSGRASIVARDGPGLTISTVMDVPFLPVLGDTPWRVRASRPGMEGPFWPLAVTRGKPLPPAYICRNYT